MVSPENTHTSNIQTKYKQVVLMYLEICVHTYMYLTTGNENRNLEFEKRARGIWEGLEGGKGRGK